MAHTGVSEAWKPVSIEEVRQAKEQAIVDQDYDKATRLRDVERRMMISKREEEEARQDQARQEAEARAEASDAVPPIGAPLSDDEAEDVCGDPFCDCAPPSVRAEAEAELRADEERGSLIEEIEDLIAEHEQETIRELDKIIEDSGQVKTAVAAFAISKTGDLTIITNVKNGRQVETSFHASELGEVHEKLLLTTYMTLAPVLQDAVLADIEDTLDNAQRLAELFAPEENNG